MLITNMLRKVLGLQVPNGFSLHALEEMENDNLEKLCKMYKNSGTMLCYVKGTTEHVYIECVILHVCKMNAYMNKYNRLYMI